MAEPSEIAWQSICPVAKKTHTSLLNAALKTCPMCHFANPILLSRFAEENLEIIEDGSYNAPYGIPSSPILPPVRTNNRAPVSVMGKPLAQQARDQAIGRGQAINNMNHPHSGGTPYNGIKLTSNGHTRYLQQQQSTKSRNPLIDEPKEALLYVILVEGITTHYIDNRSNNTLREETAYEQQGMGHRIKEEFCFINDLDYWIKALVDTHLRWKSQRKIAEVDLACKLHQKGSKLEFEFPSKKIWKEKTLQSLLKHFPVFHEKIYRTMVVIFKSKAFEFVGDTDPDEDLPSLSELFKPFKQENQQGGAIKQESPLKRAKSEIVIPKIEMAEGGPKSDLKKPTKSQSNEELRPLTPTNRNTNRKRGNNNMSPLAPVAHPTRRKNTTKGLPTTLPIEDEPLNELPILRSRSGRQIRPRQNR